MDLKVLDKDLEVVAIVDVYESFLWVDRYYQYGDFELYTAMREGILDYIKQDYYLQMRTSDRAMIIETIRITSDSENGNHITVTGRSLESLLSRRIVWGQKTLTGNLQNGIKTLLEEAFISPTDKKRKVSNFIFKESEDPKITDLKIDTQYTGDNLYDVIQKICEEKNIGFKITINEQKQFVFELYVGTDRSYDQTDVPYVVFSPHFDNILNSNYLESKTALKNITLVGGQGEGKDRIYTTVGAGEGLDRREVFTDARDLSKDSGDGGTLSDSAYLGLLKQRGKEKLSENKDVTSFEGQVETTVIYRYGEDFFDGDIVQVENEYGHESKARIIELITSENEEGFSVYPTFKIVEDDEAAQQDPDTVLLIHGEEIIDDSVYVNAITNNGVVVSADQSKFGGKSMYFNGSTAYLQVPSELFDFKDDDFTVDWWEYVTGNSATRFCTSRNANGYSGILAGYSGNANVLYMSTTGTSWDLASRIAAFSTTLNEWVHWAFVRNGNAVYIFRNGELFKNIPINGSLYYNEKILLIGSGLDSAQCYFQGYIDEFRISKIARWTENFTPPTEPYK